MLIDSAIVCNENDPDYNGWKSSFGEDGVPLYRDFFVYDVTNAAEVINSGAKPEVHQLGPWVYECREEKFSIEFKGATVSYKSYKRCLFDADNARNCEECNTNDVSVTNYNPGYAQVLTSANQEGLLFLQASGCSQAQIGNIGALPITDPCNWDFTDPTSPVPPSDESCACCVPDQIDTSAMEAGTGMPTFITGENVKLGIEAAKSTTFPTAMTCSALLSPDGFASSLGFLAEIDGGLPTTMTSSVGLPIYSELMTTKTVSELASGYPNSLAGYFAATQSVLPGSAEAAMAQLPDGTSAEMIAQVVNGAKIAGLASVDIGGYTLGGYTSDVAEVCKDTCAFSPLVDLTNPATYAYIPLSRCSGKAATADELPQRLKYLGGIDCAPLSSAFVASISCALDPTSDCKCGVSGGEFDFAIDPATGAITGSPCCFAYGTASGSDVSGVGCLAHIPGYVVERNLYDEDEATAFYLSDPDHYVEDTGCSVKGEPGTGVQELLKYMDEDTASVWMPPLGASDLPTPYDVSVFNDGTSDTIKVNKVSGKNGGAQIKPTGLTTREWGTTGFNDGTVVDSYDVFVSQVGEAVTVTHTGEEVVKGITLQKFKASSALLDATAENLAKGIAVAGAGTAIGTYAYGFTLMVSMPNFMYGDAKWFTSIDLYMDYELGTGDKLETPVHISSSEVAEQYEDSFIVYLNIEPSTGKAMVGHNRLMGSFYTYACNPQNGLPLDLACGLFPQAVDLTAGDTVPSCAMNLMVGYYPCSAANVLTPKAPSDVAIPAYWLDEWSEIPDASAATFVQFGEYLQYIDAGSVISGFIGLLMFMCGIYMSVSSS